MTRRSIATGLMALGLLWGAEVRAQKPAKTSRAGVPMIVEGSGAQQTRDDFNRVMGQFPPSVRQVLAMDPALLENEGYLNQYPALQAFVGAHPEVVRNAAFYVGDPPAFYRRDNFTPAQLIMRDVMSGVAAFVIISLLVSLLVWMIRTLVDYRRWNRLTRIQTDVHTRLLERFTSNEELMAYIQSPAGAKFLESSPILLDAGQRNVAAPVGRILWSLQAGIVILALGLGLLAVKVAPEAADLAQGFGMLTAAVGAGFIVSAGVSYLLSRRLGLIDAPAGRQTPGGGE